MENNTPLLNVSGKASLGNYAALPGSGPAGQVCSHCSLLDPVGSRFTCGKFENLTGRKGKPISPASAACRYFTLRPAFNAPRTDP
jgi:hypothetical protein